MKTFQFVLLALLASTSVLPAATVQSKPIKIPLANMNKAEVIAGAAEAFLPLVARSRPDTWAVVKIITDPSSGCATPSGFATISGSYAALHQLGADVNSPSGRYSWSQPEGLMLSRYSTLRRPDLEISRYLESEIFSYRLVGEIPQSATHYLLCILHEKTLGQDEFTHIHLIPDGWQDDVLPAVQYLRAHPKLTDGNVNELGQAQARSLLRDPNPFLAVTAIQLLAAGKSLTPADMDAVLSSANPKVIGCGIGIARLYSWLDSAANAEWLTARVKAIKSMNQLAGIAQGAYAMTSLISMLYSNPTDDLPNLPAATAFTDAQEDYLRNSLMPVVRRKLQELVPGGAAMDERWRTIDSICRMFGA